MVTATALAQELRTKTAVPPSASHRLLQLPEDGAGSLMEQFRVLQHLQELVANQEQSQAAGRPDGVPGVSAEWLNQMRGLLTPEQQKMLDMAQQQLGNLSGLDESVQRKLADAISSLPSDPERARATAEELLRRYHQTGQLPFSRNGNNLQEHLHAPEQRNSAPFDRVAPSDISNTEAANPTGNTNSANLSSATARPSQPTIEAKPGPGLRPIGPARSSAPGRQQQAGSTKEPPQQRTAQDFPAPDITAQELNAARSTSQPGNASGSGPWSSQNAMRAPRSSVEQPSVEQAAQPQSLDGLTNNPPLDGAAIPTASELLKQAKVNPTSLPPLRFPTNSLNLDEIKKFLAERFAGRSNSQDPWLDSLKRSLPTSLKAELNKTGLTQSLTRIMDEMKQGSDGNKEESSSDSLQFEFDALKKSLDGATLGSIQQELERISSLQSTNSPKPASAPQKTALSASEKNKADKPTEDGFFKRASTIFNQWMPRDTDDSPTATQTAGGAPHAEGSGLPRIVYVVMGLAFLGFAVAVLLRRRKQSISYRVAELAQLKIATRADIVRAFHRMVGDLGMSTEDWWTHRRTAIEVARLKPTVERNLEILAGLYEIARYSPSEVQLTEEQILQASRALEQIATC